MLLTLEKNYRLNDLYRLRSLRIVIFGLTGLIITSLLPINQHILNKDSYLLIHTVLEMIPIIIGLMVFSLIWSSRQFHSYQDILIGSSLLAVSMLDFVHVFAFPGMPDWFTHSTTEKAINFWLAARYCSALTLIMASYTSTKIASNWMLINLQVTAFVMFALFIIWVGLNYTELVPRTYIEGEGLTSFKIYAEYFLVVLFVYAAYRFYLNSNNNEKLSSLFIACCFMAMSEIFFTLYISVYDIYNFLGHVYKLIAFIFLYKGVYVSLVIDPYSNAIQNRQMLQQFFDTIPDLFWVKDINGRYIMCNDSFEKHIGLSANQIIGKSDHELIVEKKASFFALHDKSIIEEKKSKSFEGWLTSQDKQARFFETKKVPVYDQDHRVFGLLGIARDLTERVEVRQKLQERDELLKKLSKQVPGVIYQFQLKPDGTFCFPYASDSIDKIYEVEAEEVKESAEKVFAIIHPDDLEHVAEKIRQSADSMTPWHDEFRVNLPKQGIRWREGHSVPERLDDGSIIWHGYIFDITERKETEEKIILAASVFEHALEGIIITDTNWNIIEANKTFTDITGIDSQPVLNTRFWDMPFKQQQTLINEVENAVNENGFWKGEFFIELEKNKQEVVLSVSVVGVNASPGQRSHYFIAMTDITILRHSEKQLEYLAHHDPLTGLPNRYMLEKQLEKSISGAKRKNTQIAVCFIDLDNFKPINDAHGHHVGDLLLKTLAARFESELRQDDTISRPGGDEFVLVLANVADLDECQMAINRLIKIVKKPVELETGEVISSSCSVGVALYPQDASDGSTLLRYADLAMYTAKQFGGDGLHMFDKKSDTAIRARQEIFENIEKALVNDELTLYYQPRINMRTGEVLGAEGLIRWNNPVAGVVGPAEFMPVIEGSELGRKVGDWVLRTGIRQLHEWNQQGLKLQVSLNIDSSHLHSQNFIMNLEDILNQYSGLDRGQLYLEIIESTAITSISSVASIIQECQEITGTLFALDDFGTGYSSLTYLRKLPVNVVKIDQSFVRDMLEDPDDLAIINSVINLGNLFGLKVIAEGVETEEHGQLLLQMGCDDAQGFGIARPMSAEELPDWIKHYKPPESWLNTGSNILTTEDIQLKKVEWDHTIWVDAIIDFFREKRATLPPMVNEDTCRFGTWLKGRGSFRYGNTREFFAMRKLHTEMHQAAKSLVKKYEEGTTESLENDIAQLETLKTDLLSAIEDIRIMQSSDTIISI